MSRVVAAIALGSNVGERERHLKRAQALIERIPGTVLLRRSEWVETEPVGGPEGQGPYLNGAALLETTLSPEELLAQLQEIEERCGRDRAAEGPSGPRTMDLDLLWHGEEVRATAELTLPHPRMEDRSFVLAPLAQVAPEHRLPASGVTVAERLRQLSPTVSEA